MGLPIKENTTARRIYPTIFLKYQRINTVTTTVHARRIYLRLPFMNIFTLLKYKFQAAN